MPNAFEKMILYLGDDDVSRAAVYLSGVLEHFGLRYQRVNSDEVLPADFYQTEYSLFILSDYPRERFTPEQLNKIKDAVSAGAGILMIGGWESFHGKNGEYHETPLAEVLPVIMQSQDDRRNYAQPLFVHNTKPHEITNGLPWHVPPTVGGFNAFTPKPGSQLLLDAIRLDYRIASSDVRDVADCREDGVCSIDGITLVNRTTLDLENDETLIISEVETVPLLVVGQYGKGRTAALATDVAPHWVGGFVDWGTERIMQQLSGGNYFIEVGNHYAEFLRNLVVWIANFSTEHEH
ncbi:MAG: glutamine amidotransferase [Thermoguttaceae bacterium]